MLKRTTFFNQLKELTGEKNIGLLSKAYHACRGDIAKGVEYINNYHSELNSNMPDLTGRSLNRHKGPGVAALTQTPMDFNSTGMNSNRNSLKTGGVGGNPVIDLTGSILNSEDAELQRAIKLSMECSGTLESTASGSSKDVPSTSGVNLSNTIPPSNMKGLKSTSDPSKRRRKSPEWPAGLKNVGNTCWFSAVIQSLFNLPIFRNLVLHYQSSSELPSPDSARYRNVCFMEELKKLFALLIGSNQSFIDPSNCVLLLKSGFDENSQQQDVSEFTHKLLDWLEDALAHKNETSSSAIQEETLPMEVDQAEEATHATGGQPQNNCNPMVELFYGEYKAHGINNGNSFTKPQKFGLFPLYVDGVSNLHDSLEFTTRDRMHHDSSSIGERNHIGQEHWFTKLPPVLIFELSRFHYNQHSKAPEKIHSGFDFPNILYMDRYMELNAERTRQCRDQCSELLRQLHSMKEELKKRRKMMLGEKSYSIQDVLRCCTEFAASKRKLYAKNKSHLNKRSRNSSTDQSSTAEHIDDGSGDHVTEPQHIEEVSNNDKKIANASVVEHCLKTWLEELEREKEVLRDDINDIQKRIESMYDDPALKQHPYSLHAVLVHQGYAVAGHYWAYVRDYQKSKWLKFNDTDVRESNWDELVQDSIGGGMGSTSAYCLMYIDKNKEELLMGTPNGEKVLSAHTELQELIEKHNTEFANEMEEWDLEQAKILSLTGQQDISDAQATSMDVQEKPNGITQADSSNKDSMSSWHVEACKKAIQQVCQDYKDDVNIKDFFDMEIHNLTHQTSMLAIASATDTFNMKGPEAALLEVLKHEWDRLRKIERLDTRTDMDVRLQHIVIYMFRNKAPRKIIERALLEQFADDEMSYDNRSTEIMKCAKEKLRMLSPEDKNDSDYQKWNRYYCYFCKATCCLIQGMELYNSGRYADALPYFANVKTLNDTVISTSADEAVGDDLFADWELARRLISYSIEKIHQEAIAKVNSAEEDVAIEGINILIESLIPWIHLLPVKSNRTTLLGQIRSDWCDLDVSPGRVQEQHECALQALMEPPNRDEIANMAFHGAIIKPENSHDLCKRFEAAFATMNEKKSGC
uniref:ubiquitin carboxyl-terminal hydrolase 25-like isoform X1 n=1 Tax=Styela clava TaxID=7725 RepID=UPI00193ABC9E|nr:ubiquitin carboxyl-terminal hydrolase 25-like isoform X1 [Styela clava]